MLYDDKDIDSESQQEEEEEEVESEEENIVRRKSKSKKSSSKSKDKKSKSSKKSRAIIEDEDEDEDEDAAVAPNVNVKSLTGAEDDDDDDDEEEDEDEEAAEGEFNGFIDDNEGIEDADEDEEVDSEDNIGQRRDSDGSNKKSKKKSKKKDKKKRRKKKRHQEQSGSSNSSSASSSDDNSELSEDDMDLIKSNLAVDDLEEIGIAKKRRRIRLASESSEEEVKKESKSSRKQKRASKSSPNKKARTNHTEADEFDDGEDLGAEEEGSDEDEGIQRRRSDVNREEGGNDDSDEEGSFIVDDSDDENKEAGDPMAKQRGRVEKEGQKKKRVYNDEAQQEALDIFGVNAEELGALSDDDDNEEEDYDEDEEELDDDIDEDDDVEKDIDDEDDYTEKTTKKRQKQQRLKVMHKMEDIFEPQELVKNLLTEFDQQIRIEDKPERFMLRSLPVTVEPDDMELEKEAKWIFSQVFQGKKCISDQYFTAPKQEERMDEAGNTIASPVIQKIKDVVNFIRNEFLEVPYIAHYRKEFINRENEEFNERTDLSIDDLWKIYEMDEKFCQLKVRKENFVKLLERMQHFQYETIQHLKVRRFVRVPSDVPNEEGEYYVDEEDSEIAQKLDSMRILEDTDLERVRNTQTVEEFLDCYNHFQLHYSPELIHMKQFEAREKRALERRARKLAARGTRKIINENGEEEEVPNEINEDEDDDEDDQGGDEEPTFNKYASRKDRFHHCQHAGLTKLAKKFGLTCEQYGENLMSDYQMHEIDQCAIEPGMLGMDFVREPFFQNVDQVLEAVKYMVAIQFAKDPVIRNVIRDLYMSNVCITVHPTVPNGFKDIDENHACYSFKYLKMKPCSDLRGDDFFKIAQAEQDGLLVVEFETLPIKKYAVETRTIPAPVTNKTNDDDSWDDEPTAPPPVQQTQTSTVTTSKTLIEKLKGFFQKDEFSYNVEQWNSIRAQVIEDMCVKFLYPDFENECRSKLLREAKLHVFQSCALRVRSIINKLPFAVDHNNEELINTMNLEDCGLRVVSVAYSQNEDGDQGPNSNTIACASYVNGNGEMEEFIGLRYLNLKLHKDHNSGNYSVPNGFMSAQKEEKIEDLEKFEEFLLDKRPNLMVLSGENKDALLILEDLKMVLKKLEQKSPQLANIPIEILDMEMPKLFKQSKVCEVEFGTNIPNIVKESIAMARYVQDPMLCLSQLCNQDRDILALKLHPMQQTIISNSGGRSSDDSTELLRLIEMEFINIVNEVGIDLNRCNIAPHTSHCLQYVAGLGPRKAQHIIKVLRHQRQQLMSELPPDKQTKTYPVATNRLFLVTKCTLGRRVFINCAGFIRFDVDNISREIEEDEDNDYEKHTEILDSTRIHPEHYEWARKIAVDALEFDESEDSNSNTALKEVIANPNTLKDLDLDAFAKELERTGYGNKNKTLYDIRSELSCRYRDFRQEYVIMDKNELFYCLIKETPNTFYPGKLILARVIGIAKRRPTKQQLENAQPIRDDNTFMWQCQFCGRNDFNELSQVWSHCDTEECPGPAVGVKTILDNGCSGFLPLRFLSDSRVTNPEERIKTGMTIHARIVKIDPERFNVEITSKSSDLKDAGDEWKPPKDKFYDLTAASEDLDKIRKKKQNEEKKQTYTKRIIAHPQFKNVGFAQAISFLKDMEIGDAVIRPSSKGSNHLTLTWKINKDCFQHVDILEEKKQNEYSIGKRLIIDGEDFEDLDEILARYIGSMTCYIREIMAHKNYKEIDSINAMFSQPGEQNPEDHNTFMGIIERALLDERTKNKAKIPYMFTCCIKYPGKFMLSYLIKVSVRNEYIKIIQEGFKFREKTFSSFNELIGWFKLHFNDPLPVRPPQPPAENKNISSQMSNVSLSQRTPSYPPPNRTPAHNNTAFDSIINNSQGSQPPADYSTSTFDNSYSAPQGQKYGDHDRNDRGRGRGRGGRGGRGGYDNNRGGGYNRDYGNRENDSTSSYRGGNRGGGGRGDFRGGRGDHRGGGRGDFRNGRGDYNGNGRGGFNNESSSFNGESRRGRGGGAAARPSRFTDNTDNAESMPMETSNNYNSQSNNNNVSTEDWDDEPARPPVQAVNPNRYNNNKTPNYEPANKTPSYAPNKTPVHVSSRDDDDDWDDEPARPPVQAVNTNRYNNNKTPNYEPANKTPNYAPNRFNNNKTPSYAPPNDDDDWDDDPGDKSTPMQVDPKIAQNYQNNSTNSSQNNRTPMYSKTPTHNNDDDDWDNGPSSNITKPTTTTYNKPYNNNDNRNNYDRNKSPAANRYNNYSSQPRANDWNNQQNNRPTETFTKTQVPAATSNKQETAKYNDEDDWDD